jgi:hypothetical protein
MREYARSDRELDPLRSVLAREHQHVDHLAGGLGGADLRCDLLPELIEAVRPGAAFACLGQSERSGERTRLAGEQLERAAERRAALLHVTR